MRRLFIYIEESIEEGTQWVVFEPNDEPLWALVRQTITNFLTTVWRNGALFGATAEEAFFVACDRSTMTQDDIDNGRLICVIGDRPGVPGRVRDLPHPAEDPRAAAGLSARQGGADRCRPSSGTTRTPPTTSRSS